MTLTQKFTVALIGGILVVHSINAVIRVRRENALFLDDVTRDSRVLAKTLGRAVSRVWEVSGQASAFELVQDATSREGDLDIRWVWPHDDRGDHAALDHSAVQRAVKSGRDVATAMSDGRTGMLVYQPVRLKGGAVGAIEVADRLVDERAYLRSSVIAAIWFTSAMVGSCGLIAWLVGMVFVGRPIRLLIAQARRIGAGDLSVRIASPHRDELGDLAREMDGMCDRLDGARDAAAVADRARTEAEEKLRHADRLATVGTLASGLAHEMGTPLNVIQGHAQMIKETHHAVGDTTESAEIIESQARRISATIRQLLDFARVEKMRPQQDDLAQALKTALNMLEPLARKHNVVINVSGTLPRDLAFARAEIQQVFTNIAMNAVDAMPSGGVLNVVLDVHTPAAEGKKNIPFARIAFEDQGTGVPPERLARIFEPFYTTKPVGQGTGLGLSVAQEIVKEHGGWIDACTPVTGGARLEVFLPMYNT